MLFAFVVCCEFDGIRTCTHVAAAAVIDCLSSVLPSAESLMVVAVQTGKLTTSPCTALDQ